MYNNVDVNNAAAWERDKKIIRELAKRYAEIAALPIMSERKIRMTANNGLNTGRPPVLLHELPWHELNAGGELTLICENEIAQNMERHFRRTLFQWEVCPGDMYVDPVYAIQKAYESTGNGIDVVENSRYTDAENNIYSHEYIDQLANEDDLCKFQIPVVTVFPETDRENEALTAELLGGAMETELRGYDIYHAPWDNIARYRGVTPILMDLYDRPTHLHAIMKAYTDAAISEYEQFERFGLLECRNTYIHCTPEFVEGVPAVDRADGAPVRFSDVWFRSMAQMFSEVSPSMHEEFDILYGKQIADRCAMTYYGCCEPLHDKISVLKKNLKNLRKIGVTPWADEEICAEQIGKDFVYAKKPNPAYVAINTDPDVIRAETEKTVEICTKRGCPYELVLKDVSTVSYNPKNLKIWAETVKNVLDGYYGSQR